MNIGQKLQRLKQEVRSISTHDDEDTAVVMAALDTAHSFIEEERQRLLARNQERIQASLSATLPDS